jgi:hypothetical protein
MKRFLTGLLGLLLLAGGAAAQPAPPTNGPFTQNGAQIYPKDLGTCFLFPQSVTGGCQGPGTINAENIFINGVPVQGFGNEPRNSVLAGPTTGSPAQPNFRSLVGADLPNPSASTLGGIQSTTGASHQWISSISTLGVPGLSQPAISDLSGLATGVSTALGTNVGSAGAFVTNGGALGTPSSGTGTNITGLQAGNTTFLQSGTGATQQTVASKLQKGFCPSPYDFGAAGDGSTDDTTAISNWFGAVTSAAAQHANCLFMATGHYRVTSNLTVTMPANSHGPVVFGAGGDNSVIVFDAGFHFTLTSSTAMFYASLRDFAIVGSYAGPLVRIATSTTDALNGALIDQLVVNNNSTDPANIGIQYNGLYNSRVRATANCSGPGNGKAHQFVAGTMNTIKVSGGNCAIGVHLTSAGNSFSGNLFDGIDVEVNSVGVQIDSANVQNNLFAGGIITFFSSGDHGINATAGVGNKFDSAAYGGAGTLFQSKTGIIWINTLQDFAAGLGVPSSGGTVTNTSGQPAIANIYGGTSVSAVSVNGTTVCNATPCIAFTMPGDALGMTYSGAPTVAWRAMQF